MKRPITVAIAVAALVAVGVVQWATRERPLPSAPVAGVPHDGGAAIRAPEKPTVPVPGGVHLTGFVVDGAGLPVAGAKVEVGLERAPGSSTSTSTGAPTGPDGVFTIEGLVPGRYRVHVTGPGLLDAEVRFVPVPSDAARIVVAREVSVDGTVTDGGKPAANAHVGLRGEAIGGTLETTSDATGAFHFKDLPEGRYQLFAWQGAAAARATRVNRLGSGPFAPVALALEAATIVVGHVIDRDEGTPVVAAVELRPSGDDQAPRYARTDPDGAFRVEGVPNGKWIADAFAPGYLDTGGIELEAGHGIAELSLTRGGAIEGRVLDASGNPVAGASVRGLDKTELSADVEQDRLRRFSGRTTTPTPTTPSFQGDPSLLARGELGVMVGPIPPIPPPGAQIARAASVVGTASVVGEPAPIAGESIWVTGADGRYRIRGFGKGKVTILAQAPGLAEGRSKPVAIDAGQIVTGVDIVVTGGTTLVGVVKDQHGQPVIGAEVSAAPEVGAPMLGFTDDTGAYKLGPVTGAIELRATAYGHASAQRKLELTPSSPPEQREDLVLEVADAMIAGILEDETGAPVKGAQLEIGDRHAIVAADGTFTVDLLPRGHQVMRVQHPDYPPAELDVVAGDRDQHVRLKLALGGAIEGALLEQASGAPITGVSINGVGPHGAGQEATTDGKGRWKLGPLVPGHWKLSIKLPGYLPLAYETDVAAAHAPGGTTVRDVRLELARGALVGGTVRDENGHRVKSAHVVVRRADGAEAEGDTDAQGEFRLRDCPPGDVTVIATRGEQTGSTTVTVRGGDEVLSLSIDLR